MALLTLAAVALLTRVVEWMTHKRIHLCSAWLWNCLSSFLKCKTLFKSIIKSKLGLIKLIWIVFQLFPEYKETPRKIEWKICLKYIEYRTNRCRHTHFTFHNITSRPRQTPCIQLCPFCSVNAIIATPAHLIHTIILHDSVLETHGWALAVEPICVCAWLKFYIINWGSAKNGLCTLNLDHRINL